METIPVNTPLLKGNELKYVTECIETGWISGEGNFVNKFEVEFGKYVDRKYAIAVTSGSAALDIAIKALDIGKGDEVIMPTFTIISPAQSIIGNGAIPILVDCDPETWNMDVSQIEDKITSKTKAILVVHTYGLPVDMDKIISLATRYNLRIIEDAAEAHAQTYKGKMCGSFGDISIFSFYANKLITTGEGGMILTNNKMIAERCKKYKNLTFEPDARRFVHQEIGWNYRITNIQAALGLAQLEKIETALALKKEMGRLYQDGLSFLLEKGFSLPVAETHYAKNNYWVFSLVCPNEHIYNDLLAYLTLNKIATRPFFWCMHEQPVFIKMGLFRKDIHPVAEKIARSGFYLPSGLGLTTLEIKFIINLIHKFFA